MKQSLCIILLAVLTSGCTAIRRLPPIKASEIHTNTSTLGVSVSADAVGVNVTETTMKVEDVNWKVTFPGFSHITHAKGYQQRLPKEDR